MTITILDGTPAESAGNMSVELKKLSTELEKNHSVNHFALTSMDLHFCTGCWSCWWKTPGRCAIRDDGEKIFRSVINSDLVIFASPLTAGFVSCHLKKIMDRLIVLLHPYIEIRNNESHHCKRYDRYPEIGLLFEKEADTDDEDLEILRDIFERFALNFHSRLNWALPAEQFSIEEIINETCSV